jgi:hypothetical protein
LGSVGRSKLSRLVGCGRNDGSRGERGSEPLVLVIDEEEGTVLDDWSSHREAKIITHVGILRIGSRIVGSRRPVEKVARPERVVAAEPVGISMQVIGPASCDHVDNRSRVPAEFRIEIVGNNPEFLSGVRVDAEDTASRARNRSVVVVDAI